MITRSDVGKGHPLYYQDYARRLADETPGAYYIDQFNNPANPAAHENGTGPEIWQQMAHDVDAIAVGVGSSGTLSGLTHFFCTRRAACRVHPGRSGRLSAGRLCRNGQIRRSGQLACGSIGEDFIPPLADFSKVQQAHRISDAESIATARLLLEQEGILAGSSTGTLLAAALRYCRAQTMPKRVVTFVADSGNKYLSKQFNEGWLIDQGLHALPQQGDLTDLITRRHDQGATITARADESLADAYARMRRHDISQLPVLQANDQVLGIIDEWDILEAVNAAPEHFAAPVRQTMSTELVTLQPGDSMAALLQVFLIKARWPSSSMPKPLYRSYYASRCDQLLAQQALSAHAAWRSPLIPLQEQACPIPIRWRSTLATPPTPLAR